jgi:hypothetical protein
MSKSFILFRCFLLSAFFFFFSTTIPAQITKSINGMVVSEIKTQQGTLKFDLPDDMHTGNVIRGTVTAIPEGKNDKEQKKNMEKLNGMSFQFAGIMMTLGDILKETNKNSFNVTIPQQVNTNGNHMTELNVLNNGKNIGSSNIPITNAAMQNPELPKPLIQLQNPLVEKDQPFIVLRSPNADLNKYEFQVKDNSGQLQNLSSRCGSPREAILELPSNVNVGSGTIIAHPKGSNNPNEIVSLKYTEVQANYQILKDNLQKNETTVLKGTITGLDEKIHHNPTLVLNNVTEKIILLERGNNQCLYVVPADINGDGKKNEFYFERLVTGITPGHFTINAIFNLNPKDFSDNFQLQMRSLQNAGEFNNWLEALKHDLSNFSQVQPNTNAGKINRQNAQTIIQNLKPCNNNDELELTKVYNNNLLRSLATDPKQLNNWDCTFVSQSTALIPLKEQVQRISSKPVDWETVNLFCENIQTRAEMAGYKKSIGPLVNPSSIRMAIMQKYAMSTIGYDFLANRLYEEIISAVGALPDKYLPKYNRPDPTKDFVGFLDPAKKTLWAVQQDVPGIISYLGATKTSKGMYNLKAVNILGQPVQCNFNIVTSSTVQLQLLFKPFADVILNGAAAAANQKDSAGGKNETKEKKDSPVVQFTPGFRVKQDTDFATGTVYRFYKNAKCVQFHSDIDPEPGTGDCTPEKSRRFKDKKPGEKTEDYIQRKMKENPNWNPDDDIEEYETGRYYKEEMKPVWKCAKGTEYCTEVLSVVKTISYYDDAKCTLLLSTEVAPFHGRMFSCLGVK